VAAGLRAEPASDRSVRVACGRRRSSIYLGLFIGVGGAFFRARIADPGSKGVKIWIVALLRPGCCGGCVGRIAGARRGRSATAGLKQKLAWRSGLATAYGATAVAAAVAMVLGLWHRQQDRSGLPAPRAAGLCCSWRRALSLSGYASTAGRAHQPICGVSARGRRRILIGALLPLWSSIAGRLATLSSG
jgi:copper transport protein